MKTEGLVKRFNSYLHRKNRRNQELRSYIRQFFKLSALTRVGYVPRIFILKCRRSGLLVTSISWLISVPMVFPATDYIFFCNSPDDPLIVDIIGYSDLETTIKILGPYLGQVDLFNLEKRLPSQYSNQFSTNESRVGIIKGFMKSTTDFKNVEILDIIPEFQEEFLCYGVKSPLSMEAIIKQESRDLVLPKLLALEAGMAAYLVKRQFESIFSQFPG